MPTVCWGVWTRLSTPQRDDSDRSRTASDASPMNFQHHKGTIQTSHCGSPRQGGVPFNTTKGRFRQEDSSGHLSRCRRLSTPQRDDSDIRTPTTSNTSLRLSTPQRDDSDLIAWDVPSPSEPPFNTTKGRFRQGRGRPGELRAVPFNTTKGRFRPRQFDSKADCVKVDQEPQP